MPFARAANERRKRGWKAVANASMVVDEDGGPYAVERHRDRIVAKVHECVTELKGDGTVDAGSLVVVFGKAARVVHAIAPGRTIDVDILSIVANEASHRPGLRYRLDEVYRFLRFEYGLGDAVGDVVAERITDELGWTFDKGGRPTHCPPPRMGIFGDGSADEAFMECFGG